MLTTRVDFPEFGHPVRNITLSDNLWSRSSYQGAFVIFWVSSKIVIEGPRDWNKHKSFKMASNPLSAMDDATVCGRSFSAGGIPEFAALLGLEDNGGGAPHSDRPTRLAFQTHQWRTASCFGCRRQTQISAAACRLVPDIPNAPCQSPPQTRNLWRERLKGPSICYWRQMLNHLLNRVLGDCKSHQCNRIISLVPSVLLRSQIHSCITKQLQKCLWVVNEFWHLQSDSPYLRSSPANPVKAKIKPRDGTNSRSTKRWLKYGKTPEVKQLYHCSNNCQKYCKIPEAKHLFHCSTNCQKIVKFPVAKQLYPGNASRCQKYQKTKWLQLKKLTALQIKRAPFLPYPFL